MFTAYANILMKLHAIAIQTLNDIIFLHFSLIVIIEAVDGVPLYVILLVTLSIYYSPSLLNLLLTHLYRKQIRLFFIRDKGEGYVKILAV